MSLVLTLLFRSSFCIAQYFKSTTVSLVSVYQIVEYVTVGISMAESVHLRKCEKCRLIANHAILENGLLSFSASAGLI